MSGITNIKHIPFYLFIIFLLTITVGFIFDSLGFCESKIDCNSFDSAYADPLAIITLALILSSLVLLVSKKHFIRWRMVTFFWLILVVFVFVMSPLDPSGASIPFEPVRDEAVLYVSLPYVFISWLIVLWGYIKGGK